jgi:signal transduction histidine kinase
MKEKPYEKPSIKRIASIEQFIRYVPSIRKSLAERDYEVASAVCALLGHEINNPLTTVIGFTDLLVLVELEDFP